MFIEQAYKGKNDWWRTLITASVASGIFVVNLIVFIFMSPEDMQQTYDLMKKMNNNVSLAINLAPFAVVLALLFVLVYALHERNILSLTTARKKVDFKRIGFSFLLITLLTVGGFAVSYFQDSSEILWNFKPVPFIILVVISVILFPIQIGFEEYLFRGYLMQQIGVIVRNRWFPLLFTSVVFGIFHSANPEVAKMGFGVMGFYIGTGLLLGIMTLMDDGMELALGFHFGNNLMSALLVTADYSALQTDAVFKYSGQENPTEMLNEMLMGILITYPVILLILAKVYKWSNWREKLTGTVSDPNQKNHVGHNPELH